MGEKERFIEILKIVLPPIIKESFTQSFNVDTKWILDNSFMLATSITEELNNIFDIK